MSGDYTPEFILGLLVTMPFVVFIVAGTISDHYREKRWAARRARTEPERKRLIDALRGWDEP